MKLIPQPCHASAPDVARSPDSIPRIGRAAHRPTAAAAETESGQVVITIALADADIKTSHHMRAPQAKERNVHPPPKNKHRAKQSRRQA